MTAATNKQKILLLTMQIYKLLDLFGEYYKQSKK